jgi:hypothetical protein
MRYADTYIAAVNSEAVYSAYTAQKEYTHTEPTHIYSAYIAQRE